MSISNPDIGSSKEDYSDDYDDNVHNEGTVFRHFLNKDDEYKRGFDAKQLVYDAYEELRPLIEEHRDPGLLAVAVKKSGRVLTSKWLPSVTGKTKTMSIGRHSCCDLRIPIRHRDISLRHAMVLFQSLPLAKTSLRVIDLHTPLGLWDEDGASFQACESNGSMFLQIGDIYLILLLTQNWKPTESAHDAYLQIPDRISVEASDFDEGDLERSTLIRKRKSTVMFGGFDQEQYDKGEPLGHLQLSGPRGFECLTVTPELIDRGLLVGRYERCAFTEDQADGHLSRVHLLFIRNGPELLAIDTGSSNGSYHDDLEFRCLRIRGNTKIHLTKEITLSWRRF